MKEEKMSFNEALEILGIEDYAQRIAPSNSHGELFHIEQYFNMAEAVEQPELWFREWFVATVEWAEKEWERPDSVYQHIVTLLLDALERRDS